jgi:aminocarboxymuconate-semialdehyde decarboxylase
MGTAHRAADPNQLTFGDHLMQRDVQVGEYAARTAHAFLQRLPPLGATKQRLAMIDEVIGHDFVEEIGIPLVHDLRGAAIGGSVEGQELSDRKFDPFWAKAEELGVLLFMHPQPAQGTTQNPRLGGRGGLGNIIGNPLETTVFLSHLIFEGTLDRFPGLRICAAHAGGFLASYTGRSDAVCGRASGADCKALKKRPSEYFRRELLVDSMIFREEGLRHLVADVGVGQLVYGTDYPYDWPVGIDFILNAPFLSNADKEAVLGGNASRLLRIA